MANDLETYFEEILRLLGKDVSTYAEFQYEPVLETFAYQIGKVLD